MPLANSGTPRPTVRGESADLIKEGLGDAARLFPEITYRQLQVWKYVVMGAENPDIARAIFLSEDTIKTHVVKLFGHLAPEYRSRVSLAMIGLRSGAFTMKPLDPLQVFTRRLSVREMEVLQGVAEGLSNAQIAARLGASPLTVKSHLHHMAKAMGTGSRTKMAVRAWRAGLIK